MKSKIKVIILMILFLLLAAGCAPECTEEEILSFIPILQSPSNGATLDYANPGAFEWTHQESCIPSSYLVTFVNEDGSRDIDNFQDGDKTTLNQDSPFLPGTSYEWFVTGVHTENDGTSVQFTYSPPSETRTFRTDGICGQTELKPPTLIYPANEDLLDENDSFGPNTIFLKWIYPGDYPGDCYPEFFHYQIAADPDFKNMITSGIVDASMCTDLNSECWTNLTAPRCASVYWRVEARSGNYSGGYSEPSQFTYSSLPGCTEIQPGDDVGLIKGFVFDDYCVSTVPWVPEGVGIFPPCVFGEPHGVHADGDRNHAPYEQELTGETIPADDGIPDVVVDLGAGPCPSTGLNQMPTMNNGGFYFTVQSPGTYCLSVHKDNNPDLDHGIWTLPLTSGPLAQFTITLNEGDDLILQDFGWDQNDYLKIPFDVDLVSFCRAGDSKDFPKLAILEAGSEIPVFARNEDATWFATVVDGMRCFISIASGSPREDPTELLIYPEQLAPEGPEEVICGAFNTRESCQENGCVWYDFAGGSLCIAP